MKVVVHLENPPLSFKIIKNTYETSNALICDMSRLEQELKDALEERKIVEKKGKLIMLQIFKLIGVSSRPFKLPELKKTQKFQMWLIWFKETHEITLVILFVPMSFYSTIVLSYVFFCFV